MMDHDLTLQSRQRPGCKSRIGKFCSIYHIYIPDLAPSDLYLFGPFQKKKNDKDQNALQKTAVKYFTSLGKEHYRKGTGINV
jgi:hypothetical protein